MKKLTISAVLVLALAALAGGLFWLLAEDPEYLAKEAFAFGRYRKYDAMIKEAARRYEVDPALIKAIIWRESRFHPEKMGAHGERGLMQITENAASDWARAEKVTTFKPDDLFDPRTNIAVGTWYLKRALTHWAAKDDPTPFALAEYNAGRTRVKRWVQDSGRGETAGAGDLQTAMDFPSTRSYISTIVDRYHYYMRRTEFRGD